MNVKEVTTFYECIRSIMANFLDACHVLENIIIALYDAMFTQSIRKEERDSFFSPENLFILKLMVDVRKCLKNGYLRKVDKSNALVSCLWNCSYHIIRNVQPEDTKS